MGCIGQVGGLVGTSTGCRVMVEGGHEKGGQCHFSDMILLHSPYMGLHHVSKVTEILIKYFYILICLAFPLPSSDEKLIFFLIYMIIRLSHLSTAVYYKLNYLLIPEG